MPTVVDRTLRRMAKVRRNVRRAAGDRARLSVFRSSKHIYAQVIDDAKGQTVASASSLEKDMRGSLKTGANVEAAKAVGKRLAERASAKGIKQVVFDRGSYLYHGRVKALADAFAKVAQNPEYKKFLEEQFAAPDSFVDAAKAPQFVQDQLEDMKKVSASN